MDQLEYEAWTDWIWSAAVDVAAECPRGASPMQHLQGLYFHFFTINNPNMGCGDCILVYGDLMPPAWWSSLAQANLWSLQRDLANCSLQGVWES